ncbi:MAG: YfdX family protein [Campylobacterales bacterium]
MKRILSAILATGLLVTTTLADSKTEKTNRESIEQAKKEARAGNGLVKEAVKAIAYTEEALFALQKGEVDKAKEALKKASGELTLVLNAPNAPYLLPVDIRVQAVQFVGNEQKIKELVEEARKLVDQNRLPKARQVLNTLRSEIEIKTINLPLASYPQALALAAKYLNEGKTKEAADVLRMALSTLVEIDTIIPIPLIEAQGLVKKAEELLQKDKKEALVYLKEAKKALEIGKMLGYLSKSSITYKMLEEQIDKLMAEIEKGHKTKSLFEDLLKKLEEFKQKAITTIRG